LKKISILWTSLLAISLVLAACRSSSPATPTATQMDANAVFTAAAQTAEFRMTEIAASTPSPLPPTATDTPEPATPTLEPTTVPITPTATIQQPPPSSGSDRAEFVSDVTVPDGTKFDPGEKFTKTWQLKNAGTTTWTKSYSLFYVTGDHMDGPVSVPVPSEVAPGQTVNVSVDLKAPDEAGTKKGYWRMANASGTLFDTSVYVEIVVRGSEATATGTPGTPGPTNTPGTPQATETSQPSGDAVSDLIVSADKTTVEETCPYTFNFSGQFTVNKTSDVTYQLEAEADSPVTLDPPVTSTFDPRTYTVVYSLEFTNSIKGWVRLHITSPVDKKSDKLNFELKCK
jgi:hypothetical protein